MRGRFALRNSVFSLLLQTVSIVCGVILPRLILSHYGSAVNAACGSITQFLGYIVLFEAGVGGVVRAALYKPLASNDASAVSAILRATDIFFRKIAWLFVGFAVALACVYPFFVREHFDFLYTSTLVLIIAGSTFVQYYFGMSRQVLLQADQRRYITSVLQIISIILNTVLAVVLIRLGCSIHVVKLGTTIAYAVRPFLLRLYVQKKYKPDVRALPDNTAIRQRWDGLGQHAAFFLHTNTDVVVLTLFSGVLRNLPFTDVSVYTIYYGVVSGVEKIVVAFSSGMEAAFGNMLANRETDALQRNFRVYEFFSFTLTTILFTCAGLLILPFIGVYTRGVTDADYHRPLFAVLLTLAEAVYCIRIPYNNVTFAAGHYRQTRNAAFLEAGVNIVGSIVLVIPFGLCGVAIATLLAMTVRTVHFAVYLSKNILHTPIRAFFGRCAVFALSAALSVACMRLIPLGEVRSYWDWGLQGLATFAVCTGITLAFGLLFYRKDMRALLQIAQRVVRKRRTNA